MTDDWRPGDLALCVKAGVILCPVCDSLMNGESAPPLGSLAEVRAVSRCGAPEHCYPGMDDDCGHPVLILSNGGQGIAARFRKIRPHTPDAEDAETIRLMTGKPAKVGA